MHGIEALKAKISTLKEGIIPLVSVTLRRDRQSGQRRFNKPTSCEMAIIFINVDGVPRFKRDMQMYPKQLQDPI